VSRPRARLAAVDGVLIAVGVAGFGLVTGAFTGAVKGYDGWGHLTKVVLLLRDFPAVDWNYDWYSGSPFFLGGYPPLFYGVAGSLVWTGVDQMVAMNLVIALSYIAMAVALYAVINMVTGARFAGLIAAGLLIGTPALWTPYVQAGLYTRVFGMAFTSIAFALAVFYLRRPSFARYLWCLAAVWGALNSHVVLGALAVLAVGLVLVLTPDRGGRPRFWRVLLLVPPVMLSAYYYLPLVFYPQGSQVSAAYPTLALTSLVALLPALPLSLVAVTLWLRFRPPDRSEVSRLVLVCGLVCAACLLYAFVPVPRLAGLRTPDMLFFLAWFVAAITGLVIGSIKVPSHRLQRTGAVTVLVAATLASMVAVLPFVAHTMVVNPVRPQTAIAGWQPVGSTDHNFRVASPSDNLSVWLNAVYDVPQTRGYAAIPQIPNPDWQYWFDTTVWNQSASEQQRTFLLDWYGVRWIYVPAPYLPSTAGVVANLGRHPDLYQPLPPANGSSSLTFGYLQPTPVALATGAPTVLVVGKPENYQLVFRDLSYSGFDSTHVIPVQGSAYVDDYNIQDLSRFDEVLIYGGGAHDTDRAMRLLNAYVRSGGGLVIEASGTNLGSGAGEPLPITGLARHDKAGDWLFKAESSPVTDGIDFGSFGPPRYGAGPWTVSAASAVRGWAQTVLTSGSDAVVVAGQLGQGRVVWSGLNLPFHIDSYRSAEESRFLTSAMSWASRASATAVVTSAANRLDPQDMTVTVGASTRGVLFKESWFDRWHAYVNGREASIDRVGPGFMYVTLPAGTSFPAKVEWRYQKSAVDWLGIGLSVATLVALVSWPRWRTRMRRLLRGWVDEEPS
jgi:hypothetical protein